MVPSRPSGGRLGAEIEFNFWWSLGARGGVEVRASLLTEKAGQQDGRKLFNGGVISLDGFIEAAPLNRDAVFGALELDLQVAEGRGRFEVGIFFRDDQQTGKCGAEAGLGTFECAQLLWVGRGVTRGKRDATDGRAGLDDLGECGFFEISGACDGIDEVGNEIRASLIDVLDLGPGGVGALLQSDEAIIDSRSPESRDDQAGRDEAADNKEDFSDAHR